MIRTDPVLAARALLAALPALIKQAEAAGGPLRLGVYGMRTALAEAQAVVDAAERPPAPSPRPASCFGASAAE